MLARSERARQGILRSFERWLPPEFGVDGWWVDRLGRVALRGGVLVPHASGMIVGAGATRLARTLAQAVPGLMTRRWEALELVEGAFALAVWHGGDEHLTLARDGLGQLALYTREDRDALWFSSDLDVLLRAFSWELDLGSAAAYLTRGHPPLGRSLASGLHSVPAAHVWSYQRQRGALGRYTSPLRPAASMSRRALVPELRRRLASAVAAASEPRQAVLLSGGVDSSLVACLAARAGARPTAFTLTTGARASELDVAYAGEVARSLKLRHVLVPLDASAAARGLERVLAACHPMAAWTAIGHRYLLAAIAAHGLGHALSGMGADELFGGYDRFVAYFYRQRRHARRWGGNWLEALLREAEAGRSELFPGVAVFHDAAARARVLSARALLGSSPSDLAFYDECHRIAPEAPSVALMGAHEAQHRIPELLLRSFEPLAREAAVELGYPFLAPELARLAMQLDVDDHFWFERGAWWAKRTLRAAARGVVPAPVVMRPRVAYDVPIASWMRERAFGSVVQERLAASGIWDAGLLRAGARAFALGEVRALRRGALTSPGPACDRTWSLLTLGAWYDRYARRR